MEKVQTRNKKNGILGLFAALTLALGVGISLSPREAVRTQAIPTTIQYVFTSEKWETTSETNNWSSGKNGLAFNASQGVQVPTGANGANGTSADSFSNLTSVSVVYSTNNKKGVGTIKIFSVPTAGGANVQVGSTFKVSAPSDGGTTAKTTTFTPGSTPADGKIKIEVGCTTNSIYIQSISVNYEAPAPKTLESIAVTKQPSKKTYYVGDTFDKTDMEVTAYYDDDTEEVVPNGDITVTPNVMALDVTSVEVDYQGEKATITGISVEPAPTVDSLEVTGTLVKSEYVEGTTFDPTGLVVTAHLSNSTTLNVTSLATYTPNPLTMGTTAVAISYGGKSASVSVTVTEFVAQVGTYTLKSNVTTGSGYDANPSLEKFDVTKTNPDQEIFALGDKENLRVGAGPNVTEIMLGGTSAAGKVSFTMPVGVYVTSITLHDLQVADGAITVNANGGTNVSLSNNSTRESLVFNVYTNKVTLNTSKRLWINSISIETALVRGAAEHYANLFLDGTHAECLAGSVKAKTWNDLGDIFIGMDWAVIEQFESVVANAGGSFLEQYVARYTYIGEKYGYDDFMEIGLVQSSIDRTVNKISDNSNLITITVLIGIIGLTTIAGYYFLQKKKHA